MSDFEYYEEGPGEPPGQRQIDLDCLAQAITYARSAQAEVERRLQFTAAGAAVADLVTVDSGGDLGLPVRLGEVQAGRDGPTAPYFMPFMDRQHLWLWQDEDADVPTASILAQALILRTIAEGAPGQVEVTIYDAANAGKTAAPFRPLEDVNLLHRLRTPEDLSEAMRQHVEYVEDVQARLQAGNYRSIEEMERATRRPEPRRMLVVLGDGSIMSDQDQRNLVTIMRNGIDTGVGVALTGVDLFARPRMEVVAPPLPGSRLALTEIPPSVITTVSAKIAEERRSVGNEMPPSIVFAEEPWTRKPDNGIVFPVGETKRGQVYELPLEDRSSNVLIIGPPGQGKSTVLSAWIASACSHYSPEDLAIYTIDCKSSILSSQLAPRPDDPSFLPHVREVGVNISEDREIAVEFLEDVHRQLLERNEAIRRLGGSSKIQDLQKAFPGKYPQLLVIIDEFADLFETADMLGERAADLLVQIARKGRSAGIQLALAAQKMGGMSVLSTTGIFDLFALRVAMPNAEGVLDTGNNAAKGLGVGNVVINPDLGFAGSKNQVTVRFPYIAPKHLVTLRRAMWRRAVREYGDRIPPPAVFDSKRKPTLEEMPEYQELDGTQTREPVAILGERLNFRHDAAKVNMKRVAGANIAVIANRKTDEACSIVATAAQSLARSARNARFSIICLDDNALEHSQRLHQQLSSSHSTDFYDYEAAPEIERFLEATNGTLGRRGSDPHFVIVYGLDQAEADLGNEGKEALVRLLKEGPRSGKHVIATGSSVTETQNVVDHFSRDTAIGTWVGLDVHRSDLAPVSAQTQGPEWDPHRNDRAIMIKNKEHQVIITATPRS